MEKNRKNNYPIGLTKILLFVPAIIDTHSRRFLDQLLKHNYFVYCIGSNDPEPEFSANYKFISYPENKWLRKFNRPYRLKNQINDWLIALRLSHIWKSINANIAHLIFINNRAYQAVRANIHPLVLTALGSDVNDRFDEEGNILEGNSKISITLSKTDFVTADSIDILQKCNKLANSQLNSEVYYFGIDPNVFYPITEKEKIMIKSELGINEDQKIILSPRRLKPYMRHDIIIEAFARTLSLSNKKLLLMLRRYGAMSREYENVLNQIINDCNLDEYVFWIDEIEYSKLPLIYGISDLAINIPENDGLPVSLFELAACKVQLITCNLPSYEGFVNSNGFRILNDINALSLSDAILDVLNFSDKKKENMLEHNFNLVRKIADQETNFQKIEAIYHSLI